MIRKVLGTLRVLPTILHVKRLLRTEPDLHQLLAQLDVAAKGHRSPQWATISALEADVYRALRLVGPRTRACVPRSLTLFALLCQQGVPVTYLSGVRLSGEQLDGHAWLEIDGRVLDSERHSSDEFTVQFRYHNSMARGQ